MKVGVLVVAYNAESTLVDVLDRIPPAASLQLAEVLVRDDHSTDETHEVASAYLPAREPPEPHRRPPRREPRLRGQPEGGLPLRHRPRLGRRGPAPRRRPVRARDHGRHHRADRARRRRRRVRIADDATGPSPRGRHAALQVRRQPDPQHGAEHADRDSVCRSGTRGYRAYPRRAPSPISPSSPTPTTSTSTPRSSCSSSTARKQIVEVPIPTYYGDEICRVNGMQYAADVIVDTMQYRLGRSGFGAGAARIRHASLRVQTVAVQLARPHPADARASALRAHPRCRLRRRVACRRPDGAGHTVTGVDLAEAPGSPRTDRRFVHADLSAGLPDELDGDYDVVVAADVIEHLADPSPLLVRTGRPASRPRRIDHRKRVPTSATGTPGPASPPARFDYDQRGILDSTHLRFFTRRSFLRPPARPVCVDGGSHTGLPLDALGLSDSRPRRPSDRLDRSQPWYGSGRRCSPTSSCSSSL